MASSQTYTTFDDYVLHFRGELQHAAKECLSSLMKTIKDDGDDWLDAHLESIFGGSSGGPIVELLKTPSKTATAKKTRATALAEKQRTEKIKGANARMALSPIRSPNSPARLLFSPLQARSLNIASPGAENVPSPLKGSPSKVAKQPAKAKDVGPTKEKAGKPKGKKAKGKKVADNTAAKAIEAVVEPEVTDSVPAVTLMSPVSRPTRGTRAAPSPSPKKLPMSAGTEKASENSVSIPPSTAQTAPAGVQAENVPQSPLKVAAPAEKSLSMIIEANENSARSSAQTSATVQPAADGSVNALSQHEMTSAPIADTPEPDSQNDALPSRAPDRGTSAGGLAQALPAAHISTDNAAAQSQAPMANVAPLPAPAPPVPVRQVRSSWLSKALGTGTVPVTGLSEANPPFRKSMAAPTQRPISEDDYAGLRKSLAPAGGLKRKSDEGIDLPEEEDESRPVKVAKVVVQPETTAVIVPTYVDPASGSKPVLERQVSFPTAINVPRPLSAAAASASAPTPAVKAEDVVPATVPRNAAPPAEAEQETEISKVAKALEDMRERTQAKELAKQKAASLAASTANAPKHTATSTGTGFLRGMANLGRSLGIGAAARHETAEEEAERLQKELEEDRRAELEAEAELARLMEEDLDNKANADMVPERSTTPEHPVAEEEHAVTAQHVDSDRTEEEEEEEVIEVVVPVREETVDKPALQKPRSATPPPPAHVRVSTTPAGSPPRGQAQQASPSGRHGRVEKHERASPSKTAKPRASKYEEEIQLQTALLSKGQDQPRPRVDHSIPANQPSSGSAHANAMAKSGIRPQDETDEEDEEDEDGTDGDREDLTEKIKPLLKAREANKTARPRIPTASSTTSQTSGLAASTSSVAPGLLLSQASTIAAKTLGVRPVVAPVKSVQAANAAAKKEQENAERKAFLREQADARRQDAARKKADEERARVEEEKRLKAVEIERAQRLKQNLERKKLERDEKMAQVEKQKAIREEQELAAKRKVAEEEANRKRKMGPMLNKSSSLNPAKRVAGPPTALSSSVKGKDAFKPTVKNNPVAPLPPPNAPGKLGPTTFRTAPTEAPPSLSSSSQGQGPSHSQISATGTITLVSQQPRPLGPPSRPSAMLGHHQPMRPSTIQPASSVLQQSRVALQAQIDREALDKQSEEIVLPDIASEYSDSDDSDKETDFKRPNWAESPELRAALERQATRNPDELFGPIRPVSMEELFKVRNGKFRPRSSSANWASGDGVTKKEELEYARRMGFKAPGAGGAREGSVFGTGSSSQP